MQVEIILLTKHFFIEINIEGKEKKKKYIFPRQTDKHFPEAVCYFSDCILEGHLNIDLSLQCTDETVGAYNSGIKVLIETNAPLQRKIKTLRPKRLFYTEEHI